MFMSDSCILEEIMDETNNTCYLTLIKNYNNMKSDIDVLSEQNAFMNKEMLKLEKENKYFLDYFKRNRSKCREIDAYFESR